MKHIMETKLKEFNYKLFSNILVNGVNLYKWKKWRSESCIYCNDVKQDSHHMLHTCKSLENIWDVIGLYLGKNITWKDIVFGFTNCSTENNCITIICYAIYKKFLIEKDQTTNVQPIKTFLKYELKYKLDAYCQIKCYGDLSRCLTGILDVI